MTAHVKWWVYSRTTFSSRKSRTDSEENDSDEYRFGLYEGLVILAYLISYAWLTESNLPILWHVYISYLSMVLAIWHALKPNINKTPPKYRVECSHCHDNGRSSRGVCDVLPQHCRHQASWHCRVEEAAPCNKRNSRVISWATGRFGFHSPTATKCCDRGVSSMAAIKTVQLLIEI